MKSSLLYCGNVNINHSLIEFLSSLFSLLFLILIISPALIILLDFDLIILPSFIIYSLGLQWAWQFNIIFLPICIGFESYCDHYIISSINKKSTGRPSHSATINTMEWNDNEGSLMVTRYLIDISQYILLPIYSFIRLFLYSFDVIHTLGFYSWGIKIDAIPGRINLTSTLRLLWKGEYRGKCFELCGQGHLSMLITTLVACHPV